MRPSLSLICLAVLTSLSSATPTPTPRSFGQTFNQIVVFGDSLSDNGNGSYLLTNRTWPADPAYFDGRFSNGQTWVEVMASHLSSKKILDLAYGGATVNNSRTQGYTGPGSTIPVPAVIDQVSQYLSKHPKADDESLYVVSGGANDGFFGTLDPNFEPKSFAQDTSDYLISAMNQLAKAGARHFLVPSTPALQKTPFSRYYSDNRTQELLQEFTSQYAKALRKATLPKHCTVTFFDESHTIQTFSKEKLILGYKNTKEACLKGAYGETPERSLCENPEEYIFWDIYHPTTVTHKYLGKEAVKALFLNGEIPHFSTRNFFIQ